MIDLDAKVNQVFGGKVVRKDLVRKVKVGANVPVFVLEYLLGKYCATDDPYAIDAGLQIVKQTLTENYVRPDESNKAQAQVERKGSHQFIDKVKVQFYAGEGKYWAELVNFGYKYVHIPNSMISRYDRLLQEGIWALVQVDYQYDETMTGRKSPFWIKDLTPIQIGAFDLKEYQEGRRAFTKEEWIDLLIRSIGLEPSKMDYRLKLLYLCRFIPLVEQNFNLVELGPRGTGKSYAYQEISPYCVLLTGPTTVANLFYNMNTGKIGLVGLWDAIAFDEVADLSKMPKEVVTTLKTYCESGTFTRGKEPITGKASIGFFGNTDQPVDVMVRSSHLFAPMPEVVRTDMAFLDRLHFYLPGWEIPKMHNEYLTDRYGFVVDYLAEAFRELRKFNFTEAIDRYFTLGSHLNTRDAKAVRKTTSGLLKIIHPHGDFTKEDMEECLTYALEGRRRVKEQLKKIGSFEYSKVSFSYIDNETHEERFVGVPEEGGKNLIPSDPLPAGSLHTAFYTPDTKAGLFRIEVGTSAGTGKLKISSAMGKEMKDSLNTAFAYMKSHKVELGIGVDLDTTDFHVESVDLLGNKADFRSGVAFFIALYSAMKKNSILPAMIILGDLTIQGNIKPLHSLAEVLQIAMENGAKKALIPVENKRHFFEVSGDIVENVDPIFYGDPITAARKAMGVN